MCLRSVYICNLTLLALDFSGYRRERFYGLFSGFRAKQCVIPLDLFPRLFAENVCVGERIATADNK